MNNDLLASFGDGTEASDTTAAKFSAVADEVVRLMAAGQNEEAVELVRAAKQVNAEAYFDAMMQPMPLTHEASMRYERLRSRWGFTDAEFEQAVEREVTQPVGVYRSNGEEIWLTEHLTRILNRGDEGWLQDLADSAVNHPDAQEARAVGAVQDLLAVGSRMDELTAVVRKSINMPTSSSLPQATKPTLPSAPAKPRKKKAGKSFGKNKKRK